MNFPSHSVPSKVASMSVWFAVGVHLRSSLRILISPYPPMSIKNLSVTRLKKSPLSRSTRCALKFFEYASHGLSPFGMSVEMVSFISSKAVINFMYACPSTFMPRLFTARKAKLSYGENNLGEWQNANFENNDVHLLFPEAPFRRTVDTSSFFQTSSFSVAVRISF